MLLLVLEPQPELSSAVAAELRESVSVGSSAEARWIGQGSVQIEHVATIQQALKMLQNEHVVGIVLDLNHSPRESLVLLRQMQQLTTSPAIIAVGSDQHVELIALLLESGCSALLTKLPYDIPIAGWVRKLAVAIS